MSLSTTKVCASWGKNSRITGLVSMQNNSGHSTFSLFECSIDSWWQIAVSRMLLLLPRKNSYQISPLPARRSWHQTIKLSAHEWGKLTLMLMMNTQRSKLKSWWKRLKKLWLTFPRILNHQNLPQNYYWRFMDLLPRWVACFMAVTSIL